MVLNELNLQPLAKHSPEAIWQASLSVLGYPPTWNIRTVDVLKLKNFLESK